MDEAGLAIDVMGLSARRRDAGVDRLTALPDQNEIVDRAFAQRSEHVLPALRQGITGPPDRFRYRRPLRAALPMFKAESFVKILFRGVIPHSPIPPFPPPHHPPSSS